MTVLVTGATGKAGRHVAAGLAAAGVPARAATTAPDREPPPELAGAERVRFDVHDPTSWPAALDGVDRVFLMRPPDVSDAAAVVTPFLRELWRRGVAHVVFLSVKGVNPLMPHWRIERDLARLHLPRTLLRAADFMQNLEGPYRAQVRDSRLVVPAGRGRTSFVDTRDVAAVAVRCLSDPAPSGARSLTCTGPEAIGWQQVAGVLGDVLGREVRYEPDGLLAYRRRLQAAGEPAALVAVQTAIHLAARAGLAAGVSDDVPRTLGRPATSFRAYAEDARAVWT